MVARTLTDAHSARCIGCASANDVGQRLFEKISVGGLRFSLKCRSAFQNVKARSRRALPPRCELTSRARNKNVATGTILQIHSSLQP